MLQHLNLQQRVPSAASPYLKLTNQYIDFSSIHETIENSMIILFCLVKLGKYTCVKQKKKREKKKKKVEKDEVKQKEWLVSLTI